MPSTTNFGWTTPADTDLVKDGAAAIRTLGNGVDASFVDLKGGTTGQILSKNSNTDLDFTWIANDQGDITAVTAGTGLTGGGTTGAVTLSLDSAAVIAPTIVDAKGDLIAATAADTVSRLAVGANDTVLTADSTTATGLKWATVSSGNTWTLLNSGGTALSGSGTVTISGISNKENLLIVFDAASSASASSFFSIRINGDTGSNYNAFGGIITAASTYSSSNFYEESTLNGTSIPLGTIASNATSVMSGYCFITGGKSTGIKTFDALGSANDGGGSGQNIYKTAGIYNASAAITSVAIRSGTGNFDAGTIYVYGA